MSKLLLNLLKISKNTKIYCLNMSISARLFRNPSKNAGNSMKTLQRFENNYKSSRETLPANESYHRAVYAHSRQCEEIFLIKITIIHCI
jgi:hypothetical protein